MTSIDNSNVLKFSKIFSFKQILLKFINYNYYCLFLEKKSKIAKHLLDRFQYIVLKENLKFLKLITHETIFNYLPFASNFNKMVL